jgi:hypothetical protein
MNNPRSFAWRRMRLAMNRQESAVSSFEKRRCHRWVSAWASRAGIEIERLRPA